MIIIITARHYNLRVLIVKIIILYYCISNYLPGVSVVMATALLYHEIIGNGSPVAVHDNRNELNSTVVISDVLRADIVGGTIIIIIIIIILMKALKVLNPCGSYA